MYKSISANFNAKLENSSLNIFFALSTAHSCCIETAACSGGGGLCVSGHVQNKKSVTMTVCRYNFDRNNCSHTYHLHWKHMDTNDMSWRVSNHLGVSKATINKRMSVVMDVKLQSIFLVYITLFILHQSEKGTQSSAVPTCITLLVYFLE